MTPRLIFPTVKNAENHSGDIYLTYQLTLRLIFFAVENTKKWDRMTARTPPREPPASEGHRRARHIQVLSYFFLFAYKYNITHRLSQHLAALSRNSTEQGERDDGDRGPGGNPADDDVKGS